MLKRCGHVPPRNSTTGSTLALSLIVVVSLVIMSGMFLQFSSAVTQRQSQATDQKRSFYIAEAGLAEAFAGVRIGKTGTVGSKQDPARFGNGLFWVETEVVGNGQRKLSSTGMSGSASAKLDLVVEEGSSSVAALGIFSAKAMELPSGTLIDAYDSSTGSYVPPAAPAPSGAGGMVSGAGGRATRGGGGSSGISLSNNTVTRFGSAIVIYEEIGTPGVARVSSNEGVTVYEDPGDQTRILGDVRPGPEHTLTLTGSPEITGAIEPIGTSVGLPPVTLPGYPIDPGYTHSSPTPYVIPAVQKGYEFLHVSANSQATITGPSSLVLGTLVLENGAELVLDTTDGRIDIYVTDDVDLQTGSAISFTDPNPRMASLQFTGTNTVNLSSTTSFQGVVYAPSAEISLTSPFKLFGSLIADALDFPSPVELHFDAALGSKAEFDALPSQLSWRILELDAGASPMGDPFKELGLVRNALQSPSQLHADQLLTLEYYDKNGQPKSYDGWESNFDWSDVSQVKSLKRDNETVGSVEGLAGIGGLGSGTGIVGNG